MYEIRVLKESVQIKNLLCGCYLPQSMRDSDKKLR